MFHGCIWKLVLHVLILNVLMVDVYPDIAEVLNISVDEDGEYTDQQKILMDNVHEETQIALEIFLRTGTMISGTYTKNGYSDPWIKVSE